MAGRITDRKGKHVKSVLNELADNLATFTLPESLPCSEVEIPAIKRKNTLSNWNDILEERNQQLDEIEAFNENKRAPMLKSPFLKTCHHALRCAALRRRNWSTQSMPHLRCVDARHCNVRGQRTPLQSQ
ncbi:hypothetical protein ACJJTC_014860 [Scirpophaga incertulas]